MQVRGGGEGHQGKRARYVQGRESSGGSHQTGCLEREGFDGKEGGDMARDRRGAAGTFHRGGKAGWRGRDLVLRN
jgi:hypothetical protein